MTLRLVAALFGAASALCLAGDWETIASVLRHPRCLNCHTVTQFPRQGDQRTPHQQAVRRGKNGSGSAVLQCASCHQSLNSFEGKVPGAPHWKLAPLSMGWEGLDDRALCETLKNTRNNGNRNTKAIVEHMLNDPLVQWAWQQQGRTHPPISQAAFHETVRKWAASGAACPK